jgi:rubrerythrin
MTTETKNLLEGDGYHELKAKSTIGEILKTACLFEKGALVFYTSLKATVSEELQPLVETLAEEEKNHFELFQGLRQHPHVLDQIPKLVKTPPNNHHFSGYLQFPEPSELTDDKSILLYAMGREQAAMEQYAALAKETPDGPLKDLFYYLAHEESQHKIELEKRYNELMDIHEETSPK